LKQVSEMEHSTNSFKLIFLKAALIASGASVIGVASDVAGSIRIPAMYNGIFGHKPTPGRQVHQYKHRFTTTRKFLINTTKISKST
jgi:hypothetical protein